MRVNLVQRLNCGSCGSLRRVKTRPDGSQSVCPSCGPTTWLALPTLVKIKADPYWDVPQPLDIFWARVADAGYDFE